jgi:hypothetical protein
MLWNRRFLFLHYPKTAGISLTETFVAAWERPVFGIVAPGQRQTMRHRNDELVFLTNGSGRESFARASRILSATGVDIAAFEAIFVAVRNPYDLMGPRAAGRSHALRLRRVAGLVQKLQESCRRGADVTLVGAGARPTASSWPFQGRASASPCQGLMMTTSTPKGFRPWLVRPRRSRVSSQGMPR